MTISAPARQWHDLGSPVVGALAAHHAKRSRGIVFISVPYAPQAFALAGLLPLIDRKLYPAEQYPDGQWDYYRFYLTHFDQTVTDFDADIRASLAAIYRSGNPESVGKVHLTAIITRSRGWFGWAHLRARRQSIGNTNLERVPCELDQSAGTPTGRLPHSFGVVLPRICTSS